MDNDDFGERTEDPTERRRQEARQHGNVARSPDLIAAGHMLAAAMALAFFGAALTRALGELLSGYLAGPAWEHIGPALVMQQFSQILKWSLGALLPILLLMLAAGLFVNVAQIGFLIAPEALQPKFMRLNPLEGLKRIVSLSGLVKFAVSLAKLSLLSVIATVFIMSQLSDFIGLTDSVPGRSASAVGQSMVILAFLLAMPLLLLGILDFGYQWWNREKSLRMTKHEIREEMKNMDGDPLIRQRQRDAHRKLAQARELRQVQEADVVITNPTHFAVALKFDPQTMPAPTVIAKGVDEIAIRIREIAAEHGVPIIERKELARRLYRSIKVGQSIPTEMYSVFVEIMAYVYRLTGKTLPQTR